MMMIAPRSSNIASVTRNTFSDTGTRDPSSPRMPSAKAMSVAAGIAQPRIAAASPWFSAIKIATGTTIPPTAPMAGSMTLAGRDSSPSRISRLSSRPTRKKKIAMSPSFTHRNSGLAICSAPIRISTGVSMNSWYSPAAPVLAAIIARTAVAISTMPPADSRRRKFRIVACILTYSARSAASWKLMLNSPGATAQNGVPSTLILAPCVCFLIRRAWFRQSNDRKHDARSRAISRGPPWRD